jgi:hypothetical protein
MRTKILISYEGGFEVDHAAAKCEDRPEKIRLRVGK